MTFLFQVEIKMKDIRKNEMALEKLRGRWKKKRGKKALSFSATFSYANRAELLDVTINTGTQSSNTERASLGPFLPFKMLTEYLYMYEDTTL